MAKSKGSWHGCPICPESVCYCTCKDGGWLNTGDTYPLNVSATFNIEMVTKPKQFVLDADLQAPKKSPSHTSL
jgi:hypothetical protein